MIIKFDKHSNAEKWRKRQEHSKTGASFGETGIPHEPKKGITWEKMLAFGYLGAKEREFI